MPAIRGYRSLQACRIVVTLREKGGAAMDIPVYQYDMLDSTNTQCRRLAT